MQRHSHSRFLAAAPLLAALTVAALVPTRAQQQFRAGTQLVRVYATVRDKSGAFALDLEQKDFEVRDNGKVQDISLFTHEAQPIAAIVLIDGSSSMMTVFNSVLDGVNQFIIRLMPGDQARVASFADQLRLSPRFTSNRDELLAFLQDQFNLRLANQTRLWDSMTTCLDALGNREGRRVLVVFSDGYDTASGAGGGTVGSLASRRDAMVYALAMWTNDQGRLTAPNRRFENVATDTGGGFYELRETDEMGPTFTQIAEELHNQYVLGFVPQTLDGKEHKLDVKVNRPDTLVRARKTYMADNKSIERDAARESVGMRHAVRAALVGAVLALPVATASQQLKQFQSRSDLVSIFATVTDAEGRLVPDLPQDVFEVYDAGKRQKITLFTNEVQPVTVVVMLDRSGSMANDYAEVRDAAAEFVQKLLPNDRARIGNFSQDIIIAPDAFTSDQPTLLGIVRGELQSGGPSPIWTAVDRSITALLHEPGRRVVLLFTDGHDNPLQSQIHTDVKDVEYRAVFDEIMVYTIGVPTGDAGSGRGGGGRHGRPAFVTGAAAGPPDPHLKELAGQSGGGYFELSPTESLSAAFTRIADELHHQYWLGFTPAKLDGKVHALEVRVRQGGLTVRGRKSYVADTWH